MRPEQWQDWIGGPGHQVFGLFDGDRLAGITAVFTSREDPSGETALLAMSFIRPEYRGQGLSAAFYDARLAWVRAHPQFRRVVVSHRQSNEPSRRANQKQGFEFVRRLPRVWPDGGIEDEVFYELRIGRL
jgi:RimJ/RimL family protein N-acetyltransferase